ncbi:MAG: phytase [Colwellia sp.]
MKYILFLIFFSQLFACSEQIEQTINETKAKITVANIYAQSETEPVISDDDAADDPAIWVHATKPARSLVLATNKKHGLDVYNLTGERVQSLSVGRVNNVDIRQNILNNLDVAVASNRSENTLTFFTINREGLVSHIGDYALSFPEPYGTCMYKDNQGVTSVFVNDKSGRYQQWQIDNIAPIELTLVREFSVPSQPEGCTANDNTGMLYFGEEEVGLWSLDLNNQKAKPTRIEVDSDILVADVEGMDLYHAKNDTYLVVSSQGDNSYAVFSLAKNIKYKGSFRVIYNEKTGIDGTQETDGLTISSSNLGEPYTSGLMVIQDGLNRKPNERQNFKYVSWAEVATALSLAIN